MTGADPTLRNPGCYLAFIWSADALRLKKNTECNCNRCEIWRGDPRKKEASSKQDKMLRTDGIGETFCLFFRNRVDVFAPIVLGSSSRQLWAGAARKANKSHT